MKKSPGIIICILFLLVAGVFASEPANTSVISADPHAVHFFYTPLCSSCHKVIPYLEEYEPAHPDVIIQYHNIGDNQDDILLFNTFKNKHPDKKLFVPVIFIGDEVLIGEDEIFAQFEDRVQEWQNSAQTEIIPDLESSETITINPALFLLAAIGEGFNPCGLLVLALLMVTLMASDSRKTILFVGSSYIVGFFVIRILSGFAIFSVIQLPGMAHLFLIIAGVIAIIAGLFQIKDGITKNKQALFSIPTSKKSIISKYLKMASVPAGLVVGALTGLYGMACTVGIYISVLGMIYQNFQSGFFYLLAYNFIVILPLIGILLLVIFGLSPEKLNSWRDERKSLLRIFIGVIMLIMGIIILAQVFL